jgi:hypothetical protein
MVNTSVGVQVISRVEYVVVYEVKMLLFCGTEVKTPRLSVAYGVYFS